MAWKVRNMLARAAEVLSPSGSLNAMWSIKRLPRPAGVLRENVLPSGGDASGVQEMSRNGDVNGKDGDGNAGCDQTQNVHTLLEKEKGRENGNSEKCGNGCAEKDNQGIERNVQDTSDVIEFVIPVKKPGVIITYSHRQATQQTGAVQKMLPLIDRVNNFKNETGRSSDSAALAKVAKCPSCKTMDLRVSRIGQMFQFMCRCGVAGPREMTPSGAVRKFYTMIINYES